MLFNMKCLIIITVFSLQTIYGAPIEDIEDKIKRYAEKFPNKDLGNPDIGVECDVKLDDEGMSQIGPLNAILDKTKRWPSGVVPYERSSYYDQAKWEPIGRALREIETATKVNGQDCVIFKERTDEQDYLDIDGTDVSGCEALIGNHGGRQDFTMGLTCIEDQIGIKLHEFLHPLGFYHEQNRGDRDDWVFINYDNIRPGFEVNWIKYEDGVNIDHLGTQYDYDSVMHYGAYNHAIDPNIPTCVPNDPNAEIGQRTHLSDMDIERVQILYECISPKDSKYFKHLAGVKF